MKEKSLPVTVKRSRAGLGLFANHAFKSGDFIIEYPGEHIATEEADRRGGKYLFILSKKITIDGKGREKIERNINNSGNQTEEEEPDKNEDKTAISEKEKIFPGEKISYNNEKDYGDE